MLIANPPFAGLSPRMRGNPRRRVHQVPPLGSIPAHAGEPRWRVCDGVCHGVYPRACGGTDCTALPSLSRLGLSPRMRGNPVILPAQGLQHGSIPAHAGEPKRILVAPARFGVYPRACGGTVLGDGGNHADAGLSPRMRGNPPPALGHRDRVGSIPAHAGEPQDGTGAGSPSRVYPRACGGTCGCDLREILVQGLSPRMRGNPRQQKSEVHMRRVYPRACGGTTSPWTL